MNPMKGPHLTRPRILVAGTVLALAGILIPISQSAQARTVSAGTTGSSAVKPTVAASLSALRR